MISTTFVTQPGIRVNLPKAKSRSKDIAQEINTVIITAENTIFINRQKVSGIEELRNILRELRQEYQGDLIVVKADENVAHGLVVGVMDIAKTSGFSRIAIATR
jgi:biopolymer transport protein ExbD